MEKPDRPKPISPSCVKCGKQPSFVASMLDSPSGRTVHMFRCECGDKTWTSEPA